MTGLDDLGARLTAAAHLTDPLTQIRELSALRASAPTVLAAAIDAAVARADETHDRAAIADALGATSDAEVRRRLTAHRARIGQPGRPGRRPKEESMLTLTDLAAALDMARSPEKVARWAGCLTPVDPRTGRIPEPWHGKGMGARFTRAEADQLIAQWNHDSTDAERVEYLSNEDPEAVEIADRYRP